MKSTLALLVAAAAAVAPAMAAAGDSSIPPASMNLITSANNAQLDVTYQNPDADPAADKALAIKPGQLFGTATPAKQPSITLATAPTTPLLILMVDPDAPSPDAPTQGFILHWMARDMMAPSAGGALTNATPNIASYIPPGPPASSSAHRYLFYAFAQPAGFALPAQFATLGDKNRARFDLDGFVKAANLQQPVAANFMYVSSQAAVKPAFQGAPQASFPGGNGNAVGMPGSPLTSNTPGKAAA